MRRQLIVARWRWAILLVLAFALALGFFLRLDFRPSAAIYRANAEPAQLEIAKIGLASPIETVAFEPDSRKVAVPDHQVGWFEQSATPDRAGVSFLSGHSDGVFARLPELELGDQIQLSLVGPTAAPLLYQVYDITIQPRTEIAMEQVLAPQAATHELVLMTCAGEYEEQIATYSHRLIIRARRL